MNLDKEIISISNTEFDLKVHNSMPDGMLYVFMNYLITRKRLNQSVQYFKGSLVYAQLMFYVAWWG